MGASNSLLGGNIGDSVGNAYLVSLGSGYYARSAQWGGNRGALSWIDTTTTPLTGTISSANSLVGATSGDLIGSAGVRSISGGNKLAVLSPNWSNGTATNAGAMTWLDSTVPSFGLIGTVSSANSLVGSNTNDAVGGSTNFFNGTGYTVVSNLSWNGNRGAVTWMSTAAPLTGVISAANSLVGANPNDYVGSGGVYIYSFYLANGDYIVSSPGFGSSSGALTIGAKGGGIAGVVSGANSLVGFGTNFQPVNNSTRLLVAAPNASSGGLTSNGRICLYAGGAGCASNTTVALGSQLYGDSQSASVTITPAQITAITNNGTDVVLQANSDITLDVLSDIITNNPSANGGGLTLAAGRSVLINSNIVTDNGNLTIVANDLAANGVSTPDRDPGAAEITMADGTLLNAGTGRIDIQMRDGLGRTGAQAAAGNINLRSIVAGTLSVDNAVGGIQVGDPAALSPSDISVAGNASLISRTKILLAGGAPGAYAQLSAGGKILVGLPDPGQPKPTLELRNGGSFARILNLTPSQPVDLKVSDCITCLRISDSEFVGGGTSVLDAITGSLISLNPVPFGHDDDTKKSKGSIEIEGGETCQ